MCDADLIARMEALVEEMGEVARGMDQVGARLLQADDLAMGTEMRAHAGELRGASLILHGWIGAWLPEAH